MKYFKPKTIIFGTFFAISLIVAAVATAIFILNPVLPVTGSIAFAAILASITFGILTLIFATVMNFYSDAVKRLLLKNDQ